MKERGKKKKKKKFRQVPYLWKKKKKKGWNDYVVSLFIIEYKFSFNNTLF